MSTNYKASNQEGSFFVNGILGIVFTAGIFIVLPAMHILGQITMETREVVTMDSSEGRRHHRLRISRHHLKIRKN